LVSINYSEWKPKKFAARGLKLVRQKEPFVELLLGDSNEDKSWNKRR
jgi:hypothetical protein